MDMPVVVVVVIIIIIIIIIIIKTGITQKKQKL